MADNEQTPTPGGESGQTVQPSPGQTPPADVGAQPGQPGVAPGQGGRRRRRRRGRRGRGAPPQAGGPQLVSANGQGPAPAPGSNGAAAPTVVVPAPQAQPETTEEVEGVLQFEGKGQGYLRDPRRSYLPQPFDVEVPRWLVDRIHLQPGVLVKGVASVRNMKRVLQRVDTVEGADPIAVARRTHFQNLTATDPTERLVVETRADELVGPGARPHRADRPRRARAHHLAAQGRQDHHAAADRAGHHREPPGRAPHGPPRGRAPRGAHRHAPQHQGRGDRLVQRPPGRGAHPRGRDGDGAGPPAGRGRQGRGDPARLDHPPRSRLQQGGRVLRTHPHRRRGLAVRSSVPSGSSARRGRPRRAAL